MVLVLHPRNGTPPPDPKADGHGHREDKGEGGPRAAPRVCPAGPPKFRGLPLAERLPHCSPGADVGAPPRLTSLAPCPLLGDRGARHTHVPAACRRKPAAVSWGLRITHRFTCTKPRLPPPHPASDITRTSSGVCPTLQHRPLHTLAFPCGAHLAVFPRRPLRPASGAASSDWTGPGPHPSTAHRAPPLPRMVAWEGRALPSGNCRPGRRRTWKPRPSVGLLSFSGADVYRNTTDRARTRVFIKSPSPPGP